MTVADGRRTGKAGDTQRDVQIAISVSFPLVQKMPETTNF
jgi:hypothetical protein